MFDCASKEFHRQPRCVHVSMRQKTEQQPSLEVSEQYHDFYRRHKRLP
jgi:hypothetical protein